MAGPETTLRIDNPDRVIGTLPRPPRVLLAEDHEDNRLLVAAYLAPEPLQLDVVTDGREAVALLDRRRYDLVLLDMQMPQMDGYEAAWAIRRREQEAGRPRVPIIAITANVHEDDIRHCLAAGCDAHLPKPLRRDALLDLMTSFLPSLRQGVRRAIARPEVAADPDVADLITRYARNRQGDLARGREALASGDYVELRRIGHRTAGTARPYGFAGLEPLARTLEAAATAGDTARCALALDAIAAYLESVTPAA